MTANLETKLDRLTRLVGTDEGFYILALHAFVEYFLRYEKRYGEGPTFPELTWIFREELLHDHGEEFRRRAVLPGAAGQAARAGQPGAPRLREDGPRGGRGRHPPVRDLLQAGRHRWLPAGAPAGEEPGDLEHAQLRSGVGRGDPRHAGGDPPAPGSRPRDAGAAAGVRAAEGEAGTGPAAPGRLGPGHPPGPRGRAAPQGAPGRPAP